MSNFKITNTEDLNVGPFELRNKWMLITAAKPDGTVNTMTANWGGMGYLWNKEVVFVVIRPQRYTKEFVEASDCFSLTFFNEDYKKKALTYLGKVSGRDEDKIGETGLTVLKDENGVPYFAEAETVLIVKKLYRQHLEEECFIEQDIIPHWYPQKDYHYLYVAEVKKVMVKK